ncbi:MAG: hypothetical protein K2H09_08370 [Treponemataceae bacterium]|nr:hypothetical protein [Treponemataceae bacterium]
MRRHAIVCAAALLASGGGTLRAEDLFRRLELTTAARLKCRQADLPSSTYGLSASARLLARDVDCKIAWKIPTSAFSAEPDWKTPAAGVALSLKGLCGVPVEIKAGNLNIAGSLSKLKAPALPSSALPFGGRPGTAAGLSMLLPSASHVGNPYGAALSYQFSSKKSVLRKAGVSAVCDETGRAAGSALLSFAAGRKSTVSVSGTVGRFQIGNEPGNSWFGTAGFFPEEWYICGNFQASAAAPHYRGKLTMNFFAPHGRRAGFTCAAENSLEAGNFSLLLSGFAASADDIFTASGTQLKTTAQLKLNPQYTFFPGAARLRTGLALTAEQKTQTDGTQHIVGKCAVAAELRTRATSTRLTFSAAGIDSGASLMDIMRAEAAERADGALNGGTYSAAFIFSCAAKCSPYATGSVSFTPPDGASGPASRSAFALTLKLPAVPNQTCSLKGAVTLVGKDRKLKSGAAECSAVWKLRLPKLYVSASAGLQYAFSAD